MNKGIKKIEDGIIKKGGRNEKPTTQRPSEPPKGQSSDTKKVDN